MNVTERCLFVEDVSEQSSASRSKEQLPRPSGTNLWLQSTRIQIFFENTYFNERIHWFGVGGRPPCDEESVQFRKYPDLCGRGLNV